MVFRVANIKNIQITKAQLINWATKKYKFCYYLIGNWRGRRGSNSQHGFETVLYQLNYALNSWRNGRDRTRDPPLRDRQVF